MGVLESVEKARDAVTVRRVFGEPYERNGVTVIPAASVAGGAGGGSGEGSEDHGEGTGMGFGLAARPAGAFVITGDDVRWHPAIDVNRIVAGGQIVAVVALLTLRAWLRRRG